MDSWVQKKREKRIQSLRERPYESLSVQEKLELALYKYDRFPREEKITYDEFVMVSDTLDFSEFEFQGKGYAIADDYLGGQKRQCFHFCTSLVDGKFACEKEEYFASLDELLEQVRIDGKTIKEIWDEVTC